MEKQNRNYIKDFDPDVFKMCNFNRRDLLCEFDAGINNSTFTEFIQEDAEKYAAEGNGVSYIVCNTSFDETTNKAEPVDVIAFYTLQATAIPYNILVQYDDGHSEEQTWGISAVEIKNKANEYDLHKGPPHKGWPGPFFYPCDLINGFIEEL